jgi:hypothetical protein
MFLCECGRLSQLDCEILCCVVAFRVYDVDSDNFVSQSDLETMLGLVVGEQLGDERVHDIARRCMEELDVDGDGKLNFTEFGKVRCAPYCLCFRVSIHILVC